MNNIKSVALKAKNNVTTHKAAYIAGAIAIAAIVLQQHNLKVFYEFLEEKGIDPMEYYCPEYFAELNA